MEPQQQQNQQALTEENGSNNNKFLCRQSSTRWTPTADQVRILKELYYNNGVRSPSAEQIQRISARLRQYGKIEGKNVFYWFQNHKARERQKKRFSATTTATTDHHHHHVVVPMQRSAAPCNTNNINNINGVWKTEQEHSFLNRSYSNINPGYNPASSSNLAGVIASVNGQMGSYGSYGSVTMEKHFRDCSISPGGSSSICANGSMINQKLSSWVNIDRHHYSKPYSLFDQHHQRKSALKDGEDEEEEENRTLPLFPIHPSADNNNAYFSDWYSSDHLQDGNGAAAYASLELSLNSYTGMSLD